MPRHAPARPSLAATLALACAAGVACSDAPTVPAEPPDGPPLAVGQRAAADRWVELTRAVVARREFGGPTRPTLVWLSVPA